MRISRRLGWHDAGLVRAHRQTRGPPCRLAVPPPRCVMPALPAGFRCSRWSPSHRGAPAAVRRSPRPEGLARDRRRRRARGRDDAPLRRAGGRPGRARIAVVPMASEEAQATGDEMAAELDSLGAQGLRVPGGPRRRPTRAAQVRRLDSVTGVWFTRRRPGAAHRGHRRHRRRSAPSSALPRRRGRRRHVGRRRDHVRLHDHRRPDPAGRHHRLLRRRVPHDRPPPDQVLPGPRLPPRRHRRPALHPARAAQPADERGAGAPRPDRRRDRREHRASKSDPTASWQSAGRE